MIEIKSRCSDRLIKTVDAENLRGADLSDANLSDANLRGADLSGTGLSDANLSGANLRGADLSDADLRDANLRGADLSGADLRGADLSGADLRGADLSGADLRGADLRGADLRGADLRDADLPCLVTKIDGLRWGVIIVAGYITIGCQFHKISEWSAFSDSEIESMDRNALTFWTKHKDMILKVANLTEHSK